MDKKDLCAQERMKTLVEKSGSNELFIIYSIFAIHASILIGAEGIRVKDS